MDTSESSVNKSSSYNLLINTLIEMGPLNWNTRHQWREQSIYKDFDFSNFSSDDFKRIIENDLSFEFEEEANWVVPIHARRILAVHKKFDLIDILILRLMAKEEEDDWANEELPEILAEFGEMAIESLSEEIEGPLWAEQASQYAGISTALRLIAEKHQETKSRVCLILRNVLSNFELNPPIFNSYLVCDLVELKDSKAAPIIRDLYAKNFLDKDFMKWEEVYETFREVDDIPEKIVPIKYNVNDFSYSGDDRFDKMLKALGSHYQVDEICCEILGAILSIESSQPAALLDDVFFDIEGQEIDFVCEGQAALFYKEFFGLWNEMSKYQDEFFLLPEVVSGNRVYRRRMQLLSFVEGFEKNQRNFATLNKVWVDAFLKPIKYFLDQTEDFKFLDDNEYFKDVSTLLDTVEVHWKKNYLNFAQLCKIERLQLIERQKFINLHKNVGRNEPCPCGSGIKFKKCCLNSSSLH